MKWLKIEFKFPDGKGLGSTVMEKKKPLCHSKEIWNQITYPATFYLKDSQVCDSYF